MSDVVALADDLGHEIGFSDINTVAEPGSRPATFLFRKARPAATSPDLYLRSPRLLTPYKNLEEGVRFSARGSVKCSSLSSDHL